jgi:hypothetical protein
MGFYDCRCMVTGLSLHGIDATLVPLLRESAGYRPITLGIAGTYDRYGAIDGIVEDTNTELVLAHFLVRLGDGGFVVDTETLRIGAEQPVSDIEDLVWCFERNGMSLAFAPDFEPVATLDGIPVDFALIAQPVWDALAATVDPGRGSVDEWFKRAFGDVPTPGDIYRGRLAEVAEQVRQLYAVADFVAAHGLAWAPPNESAQRYPNGAGGQHHSGEVRLFFDEARRDYAGVPVVRAALDEYERDELPQWPEEGD